MTKLTIDHTRIRADILTIERTNAHHDPDGSVFPWRDLYPLSGQSVYHAGLLWYVGGKLPGEPADLRHLYLLGPATSLDQQEAVTVDRSELRPVTWTQDDEDVFGGSELQLKDLTRLAPGRSIPAGGFGIVVRIQVEWHMRERLVELERHDLSKLTAPLVIPSEENRMVFWAAIKSSLTR